MRFWRIALAIWNLVIVVYLIAALSWPHVHHQVKVVEITAGESRGEPFNLSVEFL
jgi:hypothetical protein